jgi:hypothetical protein
MRAVWHIAATLLLAAPIAHAEGSAEPPPQPAPPAEAPPGSSADGTRSIRVGALAGVGFPRSASFEAFARLGRYVGLRVEYGVLPSISVDGVSASSWAVSPDLRVFPFHSVFFVGLRGGFQRIDASASAYSLAESATLDTWFVNPRIGFLWRASYGFTIATEAGVEMPLASNFSTTLPSDAAALVHSSMLLRTLSGTLPTVDLVRVGVLF